MRARAALLTLLPLMTAAGPNNAGVVSPKPDAVAVTVYRAPYRRQTEAIQLDNLQGYALITETRTVRVPVGRATLRFEGVSGGIIPASAVVTGLPGGVIEKNRDVRLLSPAALIDGSLGGHVTIRRVDKQSGRVGEEDAEVLSGAQNGVVLRTASGVETLRCSGLPEATHFARVPPGLSAKPVLSVETQSPRAMSARLTLSYLASGFDWSASYVATLTPDGGHLDLFAWATLANGNAESLPDAAVSIVAGQLNRRGDRELVAAVGRLELHCYPLGTTTSDLRVRSAELEQDAIIITANKRAIPMPMMAMAAPAPLPPPPPPPPEDLGDVKLYRVPERATVAAKAQKQVALLAQAAVPIERFYRFDGISLGNGPQVARIVLRAHNDKAAGLGIALPSGTTALYAGGAQRLLLGVGQLHDIAEGEEVRIAAGTSTMVQLEALVGADRATTLTITNANAAPAPIEVAIGYAGAREVRASTPLVRRDGVQTWIATVPANGSAVLVYKSR